MFKNKNTTTTTVSLSIILQCNISFATELPDITISSTYTYAYIDGSFSYSGYSMSDFNLSGRAAAVASASRGAAKLSYFCTNPALSSAAKSTTSKTDVTNRWLTAQEIYNSINAAKQMSLYRAYYGNMQILVDGKSISTFQVTYADGFQESWILNPGNATSSIKLFDNPVPNSLKKSSSGCLA